MSDFKELEAEAASIQREVGQFNPRTDRLISLLFAELRRLATADQAERERYLYIDCEFNGGKGDLISMALVAEDGREFYEVVPLPTNIDPWVRANVVPILHKEPIPIAEFHNRLFAFLDQFKEPTIVADHPADIAYFADALITNKMGQSYKCDWKALRRNVDYDSAMPHNALADARALRAALQSPVAAGRDEG